MLKNLSIAATLILCACSAPRHYYDFGNPKEFSRNAEKSPLIVNYATAEASSFPRAMNPTEERAIEHPEPVEVPRQNNALAQNDQNISTTTVATNETQETMVSRSRVTKRSHFSLKKEKRTKDSSKDGWAIAGFVCSLVGLFVLWPLCILGIIFSAIGMKSSRRGLATAGLVIGIVGLVFVIVFAGAAASL